MSSTSPQNSPEPDTAYIGDGGASEYDSEGGVANDLETSDSPHGFVEGMDLAGFAGPSEPVVKPLTPESLAAFKAAQDRAGVIYISRIPPGMRPAKVRHLMSAYGEIGRVYLQQEGMWCHNLSPAKSAQLFSLICRCKKGVSTSQVYLYEEGPLY